ncbi:MAG TPA: RNA polymerase sigma-70 factor [Chitinophagaceae bacterium]|nr:RNA polymerase sigma-70 factor [Chitinophagaceae bacterium]
MSLSVQDILFLQNRVAYTRDQQAYKKLFVHFYTPLHRFADNMVRDEESADEIVSDVLMKVWEMDNKLAQVDKLNLYLFTAVKNTALTHLSRTGIDKLELDSSFEHNLPDDTGDPESRMVFNEVQLEIETAIRSLPPKCQLVFRLIREEGFSYKEVCSILQVTQNTVETQMRIALKKMQSALDHYLSEKK